METKTRIGKNAKGHNYKYTDLAQIHEYLEDRKMSYYQYIETDAKGDDYIITIPIIDGKEQAPRRGVKVVDAILNGVKNPAQEQGSATTYARRYSLLMAFGLATEDDDGASLEKKEVRKTAIDNVQTKEDIKKYAKLKSEFDKYLIETETDLEKILQHYSVLDSTQLTFEQLTDAIKLMAKKIKPKEEKGVF